MKKLVFLLAAFCLLSIGAFAQTKTPDYSGEWSLDKAKSTLTGRTANLESMTMTVTQSDKELKVTTSAKRSASTQSTGGAPPADGTPSAGGPPAGSGGGRGSGGGMGMGDQTIAYSLDGKETSAEVQGGMGGTSTIKMTAKMDGGKLNLTNTRTFNTQMGEMKMTTKETWELQTDGSLKVNRDTESPRGTESNVFVFTKKAK